MASRRPHSSPQGMRAPFSVIRFTRDDLGQSMIETALMLPMNMYGTIYIPSASFAATGGHPNILGGQIVAKRVSLGAANVGIVFNATTSAQPKLPRLSK